MKRISQLWVLASAVVALTLSASHANAQGRGNFDPAQFRQRMMDRYKEALEVKSDDEWKLIQDRIEKVMEAQRETRMGGGFFGRGRGPGGPPPAAQADNQDQNNRRNRRFGPEPSPEAEALQKAIESNASADDIKSKLAAYQAAHKEKEANLTKAQDSLRQVLSVKQEAQATLMGLLD